MYFCDESRFGLITKNGKVLTAKRVKPICPFQQVFKFLWLFGAFSPITGDKFLLEMPHCNTDNFQTFLDELSKHQPDVFNILILDNGVFHKSKKLQVPENIGLIFYLLIVQNLIQQKTCGETIKQNLQKNVTKH